MSAAPPRPLFRYYRRPVRAGRDGEPFEPTIREHATTMQQKLTRIGIFYDGNYFLHVSNYYHYVHERRSRINISGLHSYIRARVAQEEGTETRYCQIVDAHYFRGRLRAQDAEQRDILLKERIFEDILMRQGVTTHYLGLGPDGEKGIDVWFALEAFELAMHKRFDVVVLVAGDGDFLPLVRKLNTLGSRVMVLSWEFSYTDQNGNERETRTAARLLDEASYPVAMHQLMDGAGSRADALVNGLFVPPRELRVRDEVVAVAPPTAGPRQAGRIHSLKEGFGFIAPEEGGSTIFFFHAELENADFSDLRPGDAVTFCKGSNDRGPCAVAVMLADEQPGDDSGNL